MDKRNLYIELFDRKWPIPVLVDESGHCETEDITIETESDSVIPEYADIWFNEAFPEITEVIGKKSARIRLADQDIFLMSGNTLTLRLSNNALSYG